MRLTLLHSPGSFRTMRCHWSKGLATRQQMLLSITLLCLYWGHASTFGGLDAIHLATISLNLRSTASLHPTRRHVSSLQRNACQKGTENGCSTVASLMGSKPSKPQSPRWNTSGSD